MRFQEKEGWGAKVIDNIAKEIKDEFPDQKGFSPRNLKYMRKFAEEYENVAFVQEVLAQIPWYHNITLFEKVRDKNIRLWYVNKTIENGWSRNILVHQIESNLFERQNNDILKTEMDNPSIGIILCKEKNKLVAEYSLKDITKTIGVSEYKLLEQIPEELKGTLPTIEELEDSF